MLPKTNKWAKMVGTKNHNQFSSLLPPPHWSHKNNNNNIPKQKKSKKSQPYQVHKKINKNEDQNLVRKTKGQIGWKAKFNIEWIGTCEGYSLVGLG